MFNLWLEHSLKPIAVPNNIYISLYIQVYDSKQ